jgi:hypothetical protein
MNIDLTRRIRKLEASSGVRKGRFIFIDAAADVTSEEIDRMLVTHAIVRTPEDETIIFQTVAPLGETMERPTPKFLSCYSR